ncbi:MAG: hypothetical protein Q8P01_01365 [bacterium]|nr:hypothetical protein [bacterium]
MDTNKTIEQKVDELERRVTKLEAGHSSPHSDSSANPKKKKISPQEFLATKDAHTEVKKVLVFAYYLEHIEGFESFNATDLVSIFRSAKEKPPKNINDVINKNINPGKFIMDAAGKKDDKKAWVLTSTGEKHVEEKLKKSN